MTESPSHVPPQALAAFRAEVLAYYREHARALPWRETRDPYLGVLEPGTYGFKCGMGMVGGGITAE